MMDMKPLGTFINWVLIIALIVVLILGIWIGTGLR